MREHAGMIQMHWISLGTLDATASAADSALGVAERNFQSLFPSLAAIDNALYYYIPRPLSAIEVRFELTTNNADVDIDIWKGWLARDPARHITEDCDLKRLVTLDVICGQQDVYGTTRHFADTINISNDSTYGGIAKSGNAGDGYTADHMATIQFDLNEANLIVFHGYGTFDEDCVVDVRGYA